MYNNCIMTFSEGNLQCNVLNDLLYYKDLLFLLVYFTVFIILTWITFKLL